MMSRLLSLATPMAMAIYLPFCAVAIRPTVQPPDAPPASLWVEPSDLEHRDLVNGRWGAERAPDPAARYRLLQHKHSGVNPGLTVVWACELLGRLSDRQWQDAFRAGQYDPDVAARFIRVLRHKIEVGRRLVSTPERSAYETY